MTSPQFQYTADGAELTEIKIVPGGSDVAPVSNAHAKIIGLITDESFAKILGCAPTEVQQFWDKDQSPRFSKLDAYKIKGTLQDMVVTFGDMSFTQATIKDVKALPVDKKCVSLQISVSILDISEEDAGHLSSMTAKSYGCEISPMQKDVEQESQKDILDQQEEEEAA